MIFTSVDVPYLNDENGGPLPSMKPVVVFVGPIRGLAARRGLADYDSFEWQPRRFIEPLDLEFVCTIGPTEDQRIKTGESAASISTRDLSAQISEIAEGQSRIKSKRRGPNARVLDGA